MSKRRVFDLERWAAAMHDSDGWPRNHHEPHLWANCNDEHRQRYRNLIERYVNAYDGMKT